MEANQKVTMVVTKTDGTVDRVAGCNLEKSEVSAGMLRESRGVVSVTFESDAGVAINDAFTADRR